MVQAGLTSIEAIQIGVEASAAILGIDAMGVLEVGKRGNFVIVPNLPTDDIRATRNIAEVFRGGFESVSPSMQTAARSLGMTKWQTIYHIRLPIGLRAVFPSWLGVSLSVIKDSALVSVIGYMELLRTSEQLISRTQQPLEILIGVGIFYFIISYPLSHYGRYVERKMAI
jgi:ABC-type amino acid transport system permease subunit